MFSYNLLANQQLQQVQFDNNITTPVPETDKNTGKSYSDFFPHAFYQGKY